MLCTSLQTSNEVSSNCCLFRLQKELGIWEYHSEYDFNYIKPNENLFGFRIESTTKLCHATVTQTVHDMVGAFEIQHWEK